MERRKRRKLTTKNNQKKKDISPFRFSKKRKLDGCSNFCPMADVSLFSFDDICFVNIAESHFVVEESKKKVILAEENQSFLVMKHKKLEQDIEEPRALNFELADGLLAELEHVSLSLCHQRFNRHLLFQLSMIIFQLAQIVGRIFHFFFADLSPAAAAPLVRPRFEFWAGEKKQKFREGR